MEIAALRGRGEVGGEETADRGAGGGFGEGGRVSGCGWLKSVSRSPKSSIKSSGCGTSGSCTNSSSAGGCGGVCSHAANSSSSPLKSVATSGSGSEFGGVGSALKRTPLKCSTGGLGETDFGYGVSSDVSYGFCFGTFFLSFFFFFPVVVAVDGWRPWLVGGVVPGVESRSVIRLSLAEGIQPDDVLRLGWVGGQRLSSRWSPW